MYASIKVLEKLIYELGGIIETETNIEAPFIGTLPENPSIYIYCPSKIDETMAPKDKESLNIMVRVESKNFQSLL